MVRPSTTRLIEAAHAYSPIYRGGLANHLPMALVALDGMSASDEEIGAFKRSYETQLEPLRDHERVHVDTLRESITREGAAPVVARASTRLAEGLASGAFHGAIRTAYALESGSDTEVAHALVYWELARGVLACDALPAGHESPIDVLTAISRDPARAGRKPAGAGIAARMAAVAREDGFGDYVARLDPAALDLDLFAAALIRAYAATGDFTLLHCVTGCHAFRELCAHFEDRPEALRRLWIAIVAAYMSCGSPPLDADLRGNDRLSWPEVHRAAARRDDEHDIKFAYSCWREWQRSGDDLYRRAASARVA
jgi:hypothetical protein